MSNGLIYLYTAVQLLWVLAMTCVLMFEGSVSDTKPYVFLIPALMLSDYYLTLYGAWLVKRRHPDFDARDYELNPMWKTDVSKFKLLNFRHLLSVAFITSFLVMLSQASSARPTFCGLFGFALGSNLTLVAEHLCALKAIHEPERAFIAGGSSLKQFLPAYFGALLLVVVAATYLGGVVHAWWLFRTAAANSTTCRS